MRRFTIAVNAVRLLLLVSVLLPSSLLAQASNLLQNPGFEHPYATLPTKENCAIAAPWVAWYIEGTRQEVSKGYRFAPEYKAAFRADYPGNRVRSGELAQQWFHSFGNFQAGVLQQVHNVPIGARLRFELWGMTWSCDNESKGNCSKATSGDPSPMHFRIGIHASGGTDMLDPAVIWSPEQNAYDSWHHFEVEAVAMQSTVTVMVYSYPDYRSQDNNVYIDDASLTLVALPPTPTKPPTATPTISPTPTMTPTSTHTPVTPTGTPTSTRTSTPNPTTLPSDAPTAMPTRPPQPTPTPRRNQLDLGEGVPIPVIAAASVVLAFVAGYALGKPGRR